MIWSLHWADGFFVNVHFLVLPNVTILAEETDRNWVRDDRSYRKAFQISYIYPHRERSILVRTAVPRLKIMEHHVNEKGKRLLPQSLQVYSPTRSPLNPFI